MCKHETIITRITSFTVRLYKKYLVLTPTMLIIVMIIMTLFVTYFIYIFPTSLQKNLIQTKSNPTKSKCLKFKIISEKKERKG